MVTPADFSISTSREWSVIGASLGPAVSIRNGCPFAPRVYAGPAQVYRGPGGVGLQGGECGVPRPCSGSTRGEGNLRGTLRDRDPAARAGPKGLHAAIHTYSIKYVRINAVDESELTAFARIRRAALQSFGKLGVAGTTIRGVAEAAGVSPGLVQHHFRSKEGLRAAVDAFVLERASKAVSDAAGGESPAQIATGFGDRIADFIRSNPELVAYGRRSLLEGDPGGLALFDALVGLARSELERLTADGLLRSDLDLGCSVLHVVLLSAAPVLFQEAVDRHLEWPFLSEEAMTRWYAAISALFARGVYRGAEASAPGDDPPGKPIPEEAD